MVHPRDGCRRPSLRRSGGPMIQPSALSTSTAVSTSESPRDPWASWAKVVDAPMPPDEPAPEPEPAPDLAAAVAGLADELADERALRISAEKGRRDAEARAHAAEAEGARLQAELAAG